MPKTKAQTMTVRLPVEVGEALVKIRDSNNLATVGSALKFWIEQQTNEKIDARLTKIEKEITDINEIAIKPIVHFCAQQEYLRIAKKMSRDPKVQQKFIETLTPEQKDELENVTQQEWEKKWASKFAKIVQDSAISELVAQIKQAKKERIKP